MDVNAADGLLQMRPTAGHLMGDRFIPRFLAHGWRPLQRYSASRTCRSTHSGRLVRRLPWLPDAPKAIDISTVAFADDIRVVHPIQIRETATPNKEAHRILDHAVTEAEHLSEELDKESYAQNLGKTELLPRTRGKGSQNIMRELLKIPSESHMRRAWDVAAMTPTARGRKVKEE